MNTRRIAVAAAWGCAITVLSASALAQSTWRVSVDSSGGEGNDLSWDPAISEDGRFVAFSSLASDLVPGDTNDLHDIFVRDRQTGATARVSVDSSGGQGNSTSKSASVSWTGRLVAFQSRSSNLVKRDKNGAQDIFVHDRETGKTKRISVDSSGGQANEDSFHPSISGDGRFVAFFSFASNLVPGDTNGLTDTFVHDRQTGATTRVSVDSSGGQGNMDSFQPSISGDGRFVAFDSFASNLVPGDSNERSDVFVHDRQTGTTTRVSVDSLGSQGNSSSSLSAISGDGRFVAFMSSATNLIGTDDTNGVLDIFVHDRQTGATTRVSVDSSGAQASDDSYECSISGDGRFVAFNSLASNLVPGDLNGSRDVFVHDRQTGTTTRVSVNSSGSQGFLDSDAPSISRDGRFVAFQSLAPNLVPGDTNRTWDSFVHGPYLTLEASPETVTTGDAIELTTYTGLPSGLVFLALVDLNGTSLFQLVTRGHFDATGIWTLAGTVPPGLSGNVMTFKSLGFAPTGKADVSHAEAITFQ